MKSGIDPLIRFFARQQISKIPQILKCCFRSQVFNSTKFSRGKIYKIILKDPQCEWPFDVASFLRVFLKNSIEMVSTHVKRILIKSLPRQADRYDPDEKRQWGKKGTSKSGNDELKDRSMEASATPKPVRWDDTETSKRIHSIGSFN